MKTDPDAATPPTPAPLFARAMDRVIQAVRGAEAREVAFAIIADVHAYNAIATHTPCCKAEYTLHFTGRTKRIHVMYQCPKCGKSYPTLPEARNAVHELDRKGINRFGSAYLWGLPPILRWILLIGAIIGITIGIF